MVATLSGSVCVCPDLNLSVVQCRGFDVPDESADADFLVAAVELTDGGEDFVDLAVVDNGEDGVVKLGPRVGAAMGVSVFMAAALDILPEGEATHVERVEQILDALIVGLVIYYQYAFHFLIRLDCYCWAPLARVGFLKWCFLMCFLSRYH